MEANQQMLINLIKQIDQNVESVLTQFAEKDQKIKKLELQNESLIEANRTILSEVKEYIEELEQIRCHYVNSNNNS